MRKIVFLLKQHFFILLTILLLLAQFFLPYNSNANSNISDGVISIHLIGDHNSDKYWFGQCLVPLKINAYMESGNDVGSIPVEKSWISGYNSQKLGKQTVTITYGGKTTTFTVTVVDYLKSINIVGLRQNYKVGEAIDLSNTSITEITASGNAISGKPITANMISGFNTSTPGTKKLTINYHKNELGQNIKIDTFITVSDSVSSTTQAPVQTSIPATNIVDKLSKKSTGSNNYNEINTKNEELINNSEDAKINLTDIIENIFEVSETKLDKEEISSVKRFILFVTRLSVLFI